MCIDAYILTHFDLKIILNMSERTYIPNLRHIFTISKNSRSTKLISRHSVARYELVDLLFFNSSMYW